MPHFLRNSLKNSFREDFSKTDKIFLLKHFLKKRAFTLFELLIVIMVLTLAVGVIGFNIHRALREQHFKTEVELVVDYLRLAQNLMLIMNADVHVTFQAEGKEKFIHMKLKVDGNKGDSLLRLVTEKEKQLRYIQFLEFRDLNKTHNEPHMVDVKFISKGSVMSKGEMRLSTNESGESRGALERFICLPGYPRPINSTTERGKDPDCTKEGPKDFDLRLTAFTVQEITAIQEQKKSTSNNPKKP